MTPVLLLLGKTSHHLLHEDGSLAPLDADVPAALAGLRPARVILAPASADCLAASVRVDDLPRRGRGQALLYRLEDELPLDAEALAVGFVEGPSRALGLAIEAEKFAPLITRLEAQGWAVERILPWPILAAIAEANIKGKSPETADVLLFPESDGHLSWIELEDGRPARWFHLPAVQEALETERLTAQLGRSPVIRRLDDSPLALAKAAKSLLAQHVPVQGDLRTGPLGRGDLLQRLRGPLILAYAAACVFVLAVAGAAFWRAHVHAQTIAFCEAEQEKMYRAAYPNQPLVAGISARLDSLAAGLAAAGSSKGDDQLLRLRDLLAGMKGAAGTKIDEIQLRDGLLYLTGQAKSATEIAQVTRQLEGSFSLDPPRTERTNDGRTVQFVLSGKPKATEGKP